MIRDLSQALYQLINAWWTGDRIRASPVEGQIFQVGPGDLLTIDGVDLEVRQRGASDSSIALVCETASGSCELFITIIDEAGTASHGVAPA